MKTDDKPRRILLPEIRVMAPRIRKVTDETVKLYPKGEVTKNKLDSIFKNNKQIGRIIGKPIEKKGEKPMYGTNASDIIKKALKK